MSSKKKSLFRNIFTAKVVCAGGCDCGKPKLSDIFQPKPKPKSKTTSQTHKPTSCLYHSSSSSWERGCTTGHSLDDEEDNTSTTFSLNVDTTTSPEHQTHPNQPNMATQCSKISDSVAVAKVSDHPYHDFRRSMLQMIVEKEIYSKDDLQDLLNCFLELNSHCHHEIIVQAFMDICNGVSTTM